MTNIRLMSWALLGTIFLSACGTTQPKGELLSSSPVQQKPSSPAEQKLALGIARYDNGDFTLSAADFREALRLGLSRKQDQVVAHKYLAFIHCVSRREKLCRDEFRKALKIDPAFKLEPAEAGHPIWGPIFLREKSRYGRETPPR